ncbi:MFS general substrate transporter [Suillus occidentalis]|nr:MFS general substrate transporter [Suillus occidentalis]
MSTSEEEKANGSGTDSSAAQEAEVFKCPEGWRGIRYHPITQVCLVGLVCFTCPGIFNALSGLGAGGQVDATTSANAIATHYATLAFSAFFAGSVHNVLGSRLCLFLGTCGYPLYIASYIATNIHPGAGDFLVVSGAISGVCAALIWTAEGSLMMAYPTEAQKGTYIERNQANKVGSGTYIGFLILTLIGVVLPIFLVDPYKMIRTDWNQSYTSEFISLFVALKMDPWIVLLFPMFFASNYFYTWLFNDHNGALFNIRTRSLNNLVYWTAQIFGSFFIGHFVLDLKRFRRRILVVVFAVHTWAYSYQKTYTRSSEPPTAIKIDMNDPDYPAHVWLIIFYGLLDSMWQTTAYWLMGAMSNDPAKLAVFAGFYKCFQSSGSAIVWRLDALRRPYMNIFISTWVLVTAGMIFAFPLIYVRVKDHTEIDNETFLERPSVKKLPKFAEKESDE